MKSRMEKVLISLEEAVDALTMNLPTAMVVDVNDERVIASYQDKHVYALVSQPCKVGDVLLVLGTSQVPATKETIKMDFILPFQHNAIDAERLENEEAELLQLLLSGIEKVKEKIKNL